MQIFIALFRGINVGGKNIVPMKELRVLLQNLGLAHVQTYIQSGNILFSSNDQKTELVDQIEQAVEHTFGFKLQIFILTQKELQIAMDKNPFLKAASDPKTLHLYFLASTPANNQEKMQSLQADDEQMKIIGNVFYLHAPSGIGRSKLAAKAEKLLGVAATARNWRTVDKLNTMARDIQENRN